MAKYMTKTEYLKQVKGKKIDTDGVPVKQPYQCADLMKDFVKKCYGIDFSFTLPGKNPHGYACGLWEFFNSYPQFKDIAVKINNTPKFTPQAGDIVLWKPNAKTSNGSSLTGVAGHVALALGKNTGTSRFKSLDQNWGSKYYVDEVNHSYDGVYGVVRILLKCTKADLNVRSGPGTKYPIVKKSNGEDYVLPKGTLVKPVDIRGSWVKIDEGQWVSAKYLD